MASWATLVANEPYTCAVCARNLLAKAFSRSQLKRENPNPRCKKCAQPSTETEYREIVRGLGEYKDSVWLVLGQESDRFTQLTAGMDYVSFPKDGRIELLDLANEPITPSSCAALFDELRHTGTLNGRICIGFGMEQLPSIYPRRRRSPLCLIQLATPQLAVLVRVRDTLPAPLTALLQDPSVHLAGVEIFHELRQLEERYGVLTPARSSVLELREAARAAGCLCTSARGYAAALLGRRLSITAQISDWEASKLTPEQLQCAATVAWLYWAAVEKFESAEQLAACRQARPDFFCPRSAKTPESEAETDEHEQNDEECQAAQAPPPHDPASRHVVRAREIGRERRRVRSA